jgi:hypothetical protein
MSECIKVVRVTVPSRPRVVRIAPVVGVVNGGGVGGASSQVIATYPAGSINISALRVVRLSAGALFTVDKDTLAHAHTAIGISQQAATVGNPLDVVLSGIMDDSNWAWIPDLPLYVGADGALTQTPPSAPSVFLLRVGVALTATTVLVSIERSILI